MKYTFTQDIQGYTYIELSSETTNFIRICFLIVCFQWEEGEVLITDNMSVVHRSQRDAGMSREKIGLRLLQRVGTRYDKPPMKDPPFPDGPVYPCSEEKQNVNDEL